MPLAQTTTLDRERERFLIRLAKRGDNQAFTELYNAHVDRIYRYIYARVSVKHVAEDLTGDVFVRVLEGLASYEDRSTPILAWMYRIANARVIDHYRTSRKSGQHQDIETVQLSTEEDIDEPLMDAYQTRTVQAAINQLTNEQQQVIMLRFVEGHDLEATAELLGKKVGAVKSLQFRAIQMLSIALRDLKRTPDK